VTASAPDSVDGQKKTGDYQLMLEYLHGGCELAKNLGNKLSSTQIPTRTEVLPNVQRFKDPAVDAAVTKLAGDVDRESQKKDLEPLIDTMMTQYPVTSLIYAPARVIYRTDKAVGWPSEKDPYANPQDDKLLMLTHLTAPK
jgi:peptide/nickel transport system substrate-binding protein